MRFGGWGEVVLRVGDTGAQRCGSPTVRHASGQRAGALGTRGEV